MSSNVCDAVQSGEACPMGATLRERVLTVARAELALGVREDAGPNRDHAGRIAGYLAPCVRDGRRLGLTAAPWCAAFVSWCAWRGWFYDISNLSPNAYLVWHEASAIDAGYPPIGYRAAVAELCADAKATGTLHLAGSGYVPQAGDVCILGRGGHNPLHGGEGHASFYVGEDEHGRALLLGGNQDDSVCVKAYARGDVLAWIALEG